MNWLTRSEWIRLPFARRTYAILSIIGSWIVARARSVGRDETQCQAETWGPSNAALAAPWVRGEAAAITNAKSMCACRRMVRWWLRSAPRTWALERGHTRAHLSL